MIELVNINGTAGKDAFQNNDNVSDYVYYFIGCLMTVIMIFGFLANLVILYTFGTNKKIRTMDNILIIGLALSDIGQSVLGLPLVVIASFSKKWIFGQVFCQYYAFVTTCLGIAQIANLTVIAMERYFVIVRLDRRMTSTTCRSVFMILFSFLYGAVWALGPLLGWSKYKQEDIGIACCVTWEVKDRLSLSYTFSICTFGWFIPLIFIAFGYISIARSIFKERKKRSQLRSQPTQNKSNRERKVAITVLMMIGAFIISWTPYSLVSLWSAVGDYYEIPMWVIVAPAVFVKCSIIWNPIIYVARHEHFRKAVQKNLACLHCFSNNTKGRSFKTEFYSSTMRHNIAGAGKQTFKKSQPLLHQKLLQSQENRSPSMSMQGRSMSLSSYCITSPYVFKRGRLEKHVTVESDVEPSLEAHSDCFEEYNDIATSKGITDIVEETNNNSEDNDYDEDDVFKDQPVPQHLSKCVQTDICLIDAIIPVIAKQDKYSQTQSSMLVSEETLDDNFKETFKPYLEIEETKIANQTGCSGVTSSHTEHAFQSNTREHAMFHQSSSEDIRTIKYLNLETLKLVRHNLKQQLEMIYKAQLDSNKPEPLCSSDIARVRGNSSIRRKIYGEKRTYAAQSMHESHNEIVPFLSDRGARERRYTSRKEVMSSRTWNKSTKPLCHTAKVERLECIHQFKTNYSKRQNKKLLSLDNSAKTSSENHPFTRQTTV